MSRTTEPEQSAEPVAHVGYTAEGVRAFAAEGDRLVKAMKEWAAQLEARRNGSCPFPAADAGERGNRLRKHLPHIYRDAALREAGAYWRVRTPGWGMARAVFLYVVLPDAAARETLQRFAACAPHQCRGARASVASALFDDWAARNRCPGRGRVGATVLCAARRVDVGDEAELGDERGADAARAKLRALSRDHWRFMTVAPFARLRPAPPDAKHWLRARLEQRLPLAAAALAARLHSGTCSCRAWPPARGAPPRPRRAPAPWARRWTTPRRRSCAAFATGVASCARGSDAAAAVRARAEASEPSSSISTSALTRKSRLRIGSGGAGGGAGGDRGAQGRYGRSAGPTVGAARGFAAARGEPRNLPGGRPAQPSCSPTGNCSRRCGPCTSSTRPRACRGAPKRPAGLPCPRGEHAARAADAAPPQGLFCSWRAERRRQRRQRRRLCGKGGGGGGGGRRKRPWRTPRTIPDYYVKSLCEPIAFPPGLEHHHHRPRAVGRLASSARARHPACGGGDAAGRDQAALPGAVQAVEEENFNPCSRARTQSRTRRRPTSCRRRAGAPRWRWPRTRAVRGDRRRDGARRSCYEELSIDRCSPTPTGRASASTSTAGALEGRGRLLHRQPQGGGRRADRPTSVRRMGGAPQLFYAAGLGPLQTTPPAPRRDAACRFWATLRADPGLAGHCSRQRPSPRSKDSDLLVANQAAPWRARPSAAWSASSAAWTMAGLIVWARRPLALH